MIDFILHFDVHLIEIVKNYGAFTHLILFLIIFCETGLVFTPFLPGDSLMFVAGALAFKGSLNIFLLVFFLTAAAILGDTVNYFAGRYFGVKVFKENNKILKKEYLTRTQDFYEKHGKKAVFLARFIPIIRTFAPFVAGIGKMEYRTFLSYNVFGGTFWVFLFTLGGYFFGSLPWVEKNFSLVIILIIASSLLPFVYEYLKHKNFFKQ